MDSNSTSDPSPARLISAAAELAPLIRAEAAAGEEARSVPSVVIDAIRDAGLFRLAQPKRFGGLECDHPTILRCLMQWSPADASTAWVAGLAIMHQWMIALFPPQAQEDIWNENPNAITFGSYAPAGKCAAVKGGFRITGTWLYASGIDHGDWGLLGAAMPQEDGSVAAGFVIVPKSDFRIEKTWDPMGLAATGSNDVVCDDVFVPGHHAITFQQLASGAAPGTQINTNGIYRYPLLSFIAYCIPRRQSAASKGRWRNSSNKPAIGSHAAPWCAAAPKLPNTNRYKYASARRPARSGPRKP